MLELKDITKRYQGRTVVDRVSLALPDGQAVSIIGPNGAGKSTLLRIMARLTGADGGEVLLHGRPLAQWKSNEFARHVSLLTQESGFQGRMTVRELVSLGRFPYCRGRLAPADRDAVERSLALLALEPFGDRFLDQLSGGQRQLARIAMALAQDAEIILLDEPAASLDINHALRLMEIVRRLCDEQGRTVAMVLHDINLAARCSDLIFAMKEGKLAGAGAPEEIIRPGFLRGMYGVDFTVMPMNGKPFAAYG